MLTCHRSAPSEIALVGSMRRPRVACFDFSGCSVALPPAIWSYCALPGRQTAPLAAAVAARSGEQTYLLLVTPYEIGAALTCGTVGAWKPLPTEPRTRMI